MGRGVLAAELPRFLVATRVLIGRARGERPALRFSGEAVREHLVDDPVAHGFPGAHEVVAFHVLGNLLERLPAVLSDQPLDPPLQRDRLPRLNLDIARLALEAAPRAGGSGSWHSGAPSASPARPRQGAALPPTSQSPRRSSQSRV
jgi:hypothetical protein